jgi:hypothetical protein
MRSDQRFAPTAASVPLAVPSGVAAHAAFLSGAFRTASVVSFDPTKFGSSRLHTRAADLATGAAVSNGCVWRVTGLRPNPSLQRTRSGGLSPPTRAGDL